MTTSVNASTPPLPDVSPAAPALVPAQRTWRTTLGNALIITRREVRDSLRDWRIMGPILILTFLFPFLAQFVAGRFSNYLEGFGAQILGDRTIPFLLMIVGFFPISISLVIALETFVGEKERRSLEPLLSTPLSNTELYIGKTLAAILPPLVSSYGGMLVYLIGLVTTDTIVWRPPAMLILQIFLLSTVQGLVMITGAVVVSSQTTSTRAANLLASFIIIPITILIWAESAIMFLAPDAESQNGILSLWAIIVGMSIVIVLLLRVGNSIFNREELLASMLDKLDIKGFFRRLWRSIRAVDEAGTPARNLFHWYRLGVPLSLRHLGAAIPLTALFFLVVAVGGYVFGMTSDWQLGIPSGLPIGSAADYLEGYGSFDFQGLAAGAIFTQNARILLAAGLLGMFSFGALALILTPATYFILGYLASQLVVSGYDIGFIVPAIVTHGIFEIPAIILATAAALKLGGVITRPPAGMGLGSAWTRTLADAIRLWVGVIAPLLLLAAVVEAFVTPGVVAAFLR
jgi:uncharacterized membrane protein SpoIIM required for sporulation/ABC-type transport system involved in multi-copper enzyme maturation permease subunit